MKVVNIIEEGKLGGPQVRMVRVASALKDAVETIVFMPKQNSNPFRALCTENGVAYRVVFLTRITKEFWVALGYLLLFPVEVLSLTWRFRRENIDVVHVSGGSWQYKGVIAGKLAGKKVLWHINDTSMPGFIRKMFTLISHLADGFIFASERSKVYYMPFMKAGKYEYMIPAPVDTLKFDTNRAYSGEEELVNSWHEKFVVGTVVNINPIKGLETLIHAAALLNKQTENVIFVVVGPVFLRQKRYYESLKQLCRQLGIKNVEFVGGRSDVRPLMKRFDVYVCSSKAESSPISVWEAMAMSKPIVSTDVGDVSLYVKDGVNGFIVKVGGSDDMARRLAYLAENEELRKKYGERCRKVVEKELDISRCAERHLKAYIEIQNK